MMIETPMRDGFLRFEIQRASDIAKGDKYFIESSTGYIHAMAIVAVSPSFVDGGSGIVLANGETIFVMESPIEVMKMLKGE
jgi:hypothetical protein